MCKNTKKGKIIKRHTLSLGLSSLPQYSSGSINAAGVRLTVENSDRRKTVCSSYQTQKFKDNLILKTISFK